MCVWCILLVVLLYVVVSLLFSVARCLGGGQQCAFLFFIGIFLCSHADVVLVYWPVGV
jgi:hypothetical protein